MNTAYKFKSLEGEIDNLFEQGYEVCEPRPRRVVTYDGHPVVWLNRVKGRIAIITIVGVKHIQFGLLDYSRFQTFVEFEGTQIIWQ